MKKEIVFQNENETAAFAAEFAKKISPPCVISLVGEIGAGKTTFCKSLFLALGIRESITSPTFTILNEYSNDDLKIDHFDFYRLSSLEEAIETGFHEFFAEDNASIVVCEWLENVQGLAEKINFEIRIEKLGDTKRKFTITENA